METKPESKELDILYHDEHYIAVNKPSGLLVHRTEFMRNDPAAVQIVRNQIGKKVFPVHRLDRSTSGVLVFALSSEAARNLCNLFRTRDISKQYLAVVRGYTEEEGLINHAIDKKDGKEPQEAVSRYQRLETIELDIPVGPYPTARYSLVKVKPETGRTHQIRRHFKHISHPVVGDTTYGEGLQNRLFREHFNIHRLLLMAVGLSFFHPFKENNISIQAPVDNELINIFSEFKWEKV
ncbi:MAG: pseudouridine synthase [Candidatus Theseobacter exili]|nr:pseudouridine synthase [Candidatus Theseobacter exili]